MSDSRSKRTRQQPTAPIEGGGGVLNPYAVVQAIGNARQKRALARDPIGTFEEVFSATMLRTTRRSTRWWPGRTARRPTHPRRSRT